MSVYAYDPEHGRLVVAWEPSYGRVCQPVVTGDADPRAAQRLVTALDELAGALWEVYTNPAADALDDEAELARRGDAAAALEMAGDAVADPRRPTGGLLTVSYTHVDECAHLVARALDAVPDGWRAPVAADVRAEADAVVRADLGDFSGRAAQAIWADRADVPPHLLAAARDALAAGADISHLPDDFGGAAATAAIAGLLHAAALIAAAEDGHVTAADVFAESDNIEVCSVEVPASVVAQLEEGDRPESVVSGLVEAALAVRARRIPDVGALLADIADIQTTGHAYAGRWPDALHALLEDYRLTPLDPTRPLADLWEHLVDGLDAAYRLFAESRDPEGPSPADGDGDEGDMESEAVWERRHRQVEAATRRVWQQRVWQMFTDGGGSGGPPPRWDP